MNNLLKVNIFIINENLLKLKDLGTEKTNKLYCTSHSLN